MTSNNNNNNSNNMATLSMHASSTVNMYNYKLRIDNKCVFSFPSSSLGIQVIEIVVVSPIKSC